jgi:hypothetical protein
LDGAWPIDEYRATNSRSRFLSHNASLGVVAPGSKAALSGLNRVVGKVTSKDQSRPARTEVIMMECGDRFRSDLPNRLRLTAVHPCRSPTLLEYRGPEGNARDLRGVGLGLFDLGQSELHMTVDVAFGE